MFYPPEGWCESSSQGVQLILFPFIGVGNGSGGFKFTGGERPFRNLENVLFDGTGGTGWTG